MKTSPFKFLDSYSKEDRNIFFGRDKEIEELHSRVFQSNILVVYGISGTGKSSLIHCGLANKFVDSDWLPVNIRRGTNINQSLTDSLVKCSIDENPPKSKNDILKLIRSVYLDHFKPVFLIFDQFEEVFIFGSKTERQEFIATLKRIVDSDLQCRLIFCVREEYLAGFTEFEKIIPSFLDNRIRIEKMTRQNAVKAIEGPCRVYEIEVEAGLPDIILEKLNPESPDIELTYLQVYLDKIFRFASGENEEVHRITMLHSEKVGDVKDLLGTFLEEQISQLDDPGSGLIILKSFVSVKGTKHQITENEIIDYSRTLGKDIDSGKVKDMIQKFIGLRILRDKDEHGRYELRHDSLASAIYEKITLVEKELLEVRLFIENSWNNYERRNLFLTKADLEYIAPYEDKLFLNERLSRFISQSKRIIHKAKRRRQNVAIIAAGIIIFVLSFFTMWAMKERQNAISQQVIAEQQKNAAVRAMTVADSARKEAIASKDMAIRNEEIALSAQEQSELAKKEALNQKEIAISQKSLAERLSIQAEEQARIATDEKLRAEQERKKAVDAEATAKRLGMLATAQNLALTSLNYSEVGLLALRSFEYNRQNGGNKDDPVIFEALTNCYIRLDSSRHTFLRGSANEIWSIANQPGLVTADLDGNICKWNETGVKMSQSVITYPSPVIFLRLSKSGKYAVTQHDNLDVRIWISDPHGEMGEGENLTGVTGFIRAVSYNNDETILAAGSDSTITLTDLRDGRMDKIVTFVTNSAVESIAFCNTDSIFFACSDGSLNLLSQKTITKVFSGTAKILSLAWNPVNRTLFTGCSDGSLLIFKPSGGILKPPSKYMVHSSGIDLMDFNSDYSLFATASRDKNIRLYFCDEFFKNGTTSGTVLIKDLRSRVRSMAFSPDNQLQAGLSDKVIRVWETSSEKLASGISNLLGLKISETSQRAPNLPR
ncbi:MAG: hypothetical protein ACM3UT_06605 [Chloroflexota bacterium]